MAKESIGGFVLPENVGTLDKSRPVGARATARGSGNSTGAFEAACARGEVTLGDAVEIDFANRRSVPIELDPDAPDDIQFALVEDDTGSLRWISVEERDAPIELVLEPGLGAEDDRGLVAEATKRAIRWVAFKVPTPQVARDTFKKLELDRRPHRLLRLDFDGGDLLAELEPSSQLEGRILLIVHGTGSTTEAMLCDFHRSELARLGTDYSHVLAFDHPTLSFDPQQNAEDLAKRLRVLKLSTRHELDILAHSRGGLVARCLLEKRLLPDSIRPGTTVFVATPNAGTPIADEQHALHLADTLTSPLSFIPDNLVTDAIDIGLEFVKVLAAKALQDLKGLSAQSPESPFLTGLNGVPNNHQGYRSISSAYQGGRSGVGSALFERLSDAVFGTECDLVVPTTSTHGPVGEFEIPREHRLTLRGPKACNHFDFWSHPEVLDQLSVWLRGAQVDPALAQRRAQDDLRALQQEAFAAGDMEAYRALQLEETTDRGRVGLLVKGPLDEPKDLAGADRTVIVIPGVMGSHLGVDDRRIWLHLRRIAFGRLRQLRIHMDTDQDPAIPLGDTITPMGLVASYEELVRHLIRRHHVSLFGYDWRQSLTHAADELDKHVNDLLAERPARPISFVAHSMGGLVLRTFILEHPDTWSELGAESRAILLGTPNRGSHEMVRNLVGEDKNLRRMALFSPLSLEETAAVVRSLPGVFQLLPRTGEDDLDLLADGTWTRILGRLNALVEGALPVDVAHNLATARNVLDELDDQLDDPNFNPDHRLLMVAGTGQSTPTATRLEPNDELTWTNTKAGDGTVPVELAEFPNGNTYYCECRHGELAETREIFAAIDDLLTEGKTERFEQTNSASLFRGRATQSLSRFGRSKIADALDAIADQASSGALTDDSVTKNSPWLPSGVQHLRTLSLRVVHASLEQARHPVIVGHYRGIPTDGAERFLDGRLDDALTDAYELGQYPEEVGESLVILPSTATPPGGIVVGLGNFGDLSVSKLTSSISDAITELIRRHTVQGRERDIGVSAVLVGSPGHHDLTIDQSIQAITTGVLRGIHRSNRVGTNSRAVKRPTITELEFIEFFGDRADEALAFALDVEERLPPDASEGITIKVAPFVVRREGGLEQTARRGEREAGWLRYSIKRPVGAKKRGVSPIEISAEGQSARSAVQQVRLDFDKLKKKLEADEKRDQRWRQSVLADLIPPSLREEFAQADNLHLRLDEELAGIPWEMLADRGDSASSQALSLRAGVIREFLDHEPTTFAHTPGATRRALVIGNPNTDGKYPSLRGAASEADLVARLLQNSGYEVELLVGKRANWLAVDVALKSADVSIIHIAAHGEYVEGDEDRTGIVLDEGQLIKAVDFQKIAKPDFVFLNACHVGSMGSLALDRPEQFAADFAVSLFRTEVRAVVAAGWEVGDREALEFARVFYGHLLDRIPFGLATKFARAAAYRAGGPDSLTWAAYQCYGKPGFVLPGKPKSTGTGRRGYLSIRDLQLDLASLTNRAGTTQDYSALHKCIGEAERDYQGELENSDDRRGQTLELFGDGYRAIGSFEDALRCYDSALSDGSATVSFKAFERRANVRTRHLIEFIRENNPEPGEWKAFDNQIEQSLDELNSLLESSRTPERLMLVSGDYRRRAFARRLMHHGTKQHRPEMVHLVEQSLILAFEAYQQKPGIYQFGGVIAGWALLTQSERAGMREQHHLPSLHTELELLIKRKEKYLEDGDAQDSWARIELVDAEFCRLLLDPSSAEVDEEEIAASYRDAWVVRSDPVQRRSVIDHFDLLAYLSLNTKLKRRIGHVAALLKTHNQDCWG